MKREGGKQETFQCISFLYPVRIMIGGGLTFFSFSFFLVAVIFCILSLFISLRSFPFPTRFASSFSASASFLCCVVILLLLFMHPCVRCGITRRERERERETTAISTKRALVVLKEQKQTHWFLVILSLCGRTRVSILLWRLRVRLCGRCRSRRRAQTRSPIPERLRAQ